MCKNGFVGNNSQMRNDRPKPAKRLMSRNDSLCESVIINIADVKQQKNKRYSTLTFMRCDVGCTGWPKNGTIFGRLNFIQY